MAVPFAAGQVAVTSSPTLVFTGFSFNEFAAQIAFKNLGTETVYLGSSTVTPTTGYPISAGELHMQEMVGSNATGNRELYAVTAAGTSTLAFLRGA